jgi:hypothetical protein
MEPQWGKTIFTCVYIGKKSLKIFFSRISRRISIKLDTNHPCIKGIQIHINKGPGHHQRGDTYKNRMVSSNFFLKKHKAREGQIYVLI